VAKTGERCGNPHLGWTGKIRSFDRDKRSELQSLLASEEVLATGQRLVLSGEVSEEIQDVSDWEAAMSALWLQLPERVGQVLSGAPKAFTLPAHDPHFLEITLSGGDPPPPPEFMYKYIDSSFHRDEPTTKDELGVEDYANALARFVLHPQTQPPLTVGIHGRWAKGKSSFMSLVDQALVKFAEINRGERFQMLADKEASLKQKAAAIQTTPADQEEHLAQLESELIRLQAEGEQLWKQMLASARGHMISITFNAWQFDDAKQTRAGLASEISKRLEAALSWRSRQWLKIKYAWRERRTELILNLLLPLAVACVVVGLYIFGVANMATTDSVG
jgi:hypothetical protein